MVAILHSVGGKLRMVGPLTLANAITNPSFEAATGGVPDGWTAVGNATLAVSTMVDNIKFGTQCCEVTIAAGSLTSSGLSQTIIPPLTQGYDYRLSAYIYLPTTPPAAVTASISYYDINGSFISTDSAALYPIASNTGPTQSAFTVTLPVAAEQVVVGFLMSTSSAYSFCLDGVMLTPATSPDAYVDGDTAGYVWNDVINSTTLKSTPPDALNFFSHGTGTPVPTPVTS